MSFAESQGEPWLTRSAPRDMQEQLRGIGFNTVEYVSRDEATARYLADRGDGLVLDASIQLMSAVI